MTPQASDAKETRDDAQRRAREREREGRPTVQRRKREEREGEREGQEREDHPSREAQRPTGNVKTAAAVAAAAAS